MSDDFNFDNDEFSDFGDFDSASDFETNFFEADDLNTGAPAFGDFDDFDDEAMLFPEDETESSGPGRIFIILMIGLAFLVVIILAVIVALLVGGGGDDCGENCQLATEIAATNNAVFTSEAATATEAIILEQERGTQIAVEGTATAISVQDTATAVINQQNTEVAATRTQSAQNATATQAREFTNQTATALALTATAAASNTPTPSNTPFILSGQLLDPITGAPAQGIILCIFLDTDGDGVLEPAEDTPANCMPVITQPATGPDTDVESETPIGSTPAAATVIPSTLVTPIAVPSLTPAGANPTRVIPTPTPETIEGSGFNPYLYQPVGRDRVAQIATPTPEFGEDRVVAQVTTDAAGNFILRNLPPGEYFIIIGDDAVPIEIRASAEPYRLIVPLASGETIEILVEGIGNVNVTITPTPTGASPTPGTGGGTITPTPEFGGSPSPEGTLTQTGLFDGEGGDVTGGDLLILLLAGGILMGIVLTARRLRAA